MALCLLGENHLPEHKFDLTNNRLLSKRSARRCVTMLMKFLLANCRWANCLWAKCQLAKCQISVATNTD